jgi:hypothetical protein
LRGATGEDLCDRRIAGSVLARAALAHNTAAAFGRWNGGILVLFGATEPVDPLVDQIRSPCVRLAAGAGR